MPLFKVAVMKKLKKKKDKEELVFMSDWFVAESPESAGMKAVIEHHKEINLDFDDMDILVRPFI